MTDDARLTPAEDQDVRRLLAEARHDQPVPTDVVDRLDRVLAGLARGDDGATTTVTEFASRRRRHRVTSLLVAAAAVVAVGFGLAQVVGVNNQGADTTSSAASNDGPRPDAASAPNADLLSEADRGTLASVPTPSYALRRVAAIDSAAFATEVTRLRQRTELRSVNGAAQSYDASSEKSDSALARVPGFDCAPADWGQGLFVRVRYDGDPGVLVFRRPTGDTQVVDLFQCGSADVVRSISLPTH